MLPIVLGILKMIGILVGLLLAVLLLLVLTVTFVPLRYRVEADGSGKALRAQIRVTWLLRAARLELLARFGAAPSVQVFLFGFRLPLFSAGLRQEAEAPEAERPAGAREPRVAEGGPEEPAADEEEPEAERPAEAGEPRVAEGGPEEPAMEEEMPEAERPAGAEDPRVSEGAPEESPFSRFVGWAAGISGRCRRAAEALAHGAQRLAGLAGRVRELLRKPAELAAFASRYELPAVVGFLKEELRYLLRHYGPRRIRGYLRFGTGDPAATAQLTGLLYVLLPARAEEFSVEPEFYEPFFETDTVLEGHVRAVHILRTAIRVFRNKKLAVLIRRIRRREN